MGSLSNKNYKQIKELADELHNDYESQALTFCRIASLGISNPRKELEPIHNLILDLRVACISKKSLGKYISGKKISKFKKEFHDFERSVKVHAGDKYIGMLFNPIVVATARVQENHFKKILLKFRNLTSLLETAYSYVKK